MGQRTVAQSIIDRAIRAAKLHNPATDRALTSAADHVTPAYTANATGIHKHLCDLSCIALFRGGAGDVVGGTDLGVTLIAPSFVIGCAHAPNTEFPDDPTRGFDLCVGWKVNFLGSDGVAYQRTITARRLLYMDTPGTTQVIDNYIGKLNAPLPAVVKPALVLPANWRHWIEGQFAHGETIDPGEWPTVKLPSVVVNKSNAVGINEMRYMDIRNVSPTYSFSAQERMTNPPAPDTDEATWVPWLYTTVGGDSGNRFGLPLKQGYALAAVYSGSGIGPSHIGHIDAINKTIEAMGGNESVTVADLTTETTMVENMKCISGTATGWDVLGATGIAYMDVHGASGLQADHTTQVSDVLSAVFSLNSPWKRGDVISLTVSSDITITNVDSVKVELFNGAVSLNSQTRVTTGAINFNYENASTLSQADIDALRVVITSTAADFDGQSVIKNLSITLTMNDASGTNFPPNSVGLDSGLTTTLVGTRLAAIQNVDGDYIVASVSNASSHVMDWQPNLAAIPANATISAIKLIIADTVVSRTAGTGSVTYQSSVTFVGDYSDAQLGTQIVQNTTSSTLVPMETLNLTGGPWTKAQLANLKVKHNAFGTGTVTGSVRIDNSYLFITFSTPSTAMATMGHAMGIGLTTGKMGIGIGP